MRTTQQSEPVQPRNDIEQLSTNPRGHIERLFEYKYINYRFFPVIILYLKEVNISQTT